MKKITMPLCLTAFIALSIGCGNGGSETNDGDSIQTSTETTMNTDTNTTGTSDTSMAADREFAMEAASGGLMEVELGTYASANASSAKVKEFGRMMVTDHTKANTELKSIAASKGISLPTTPTEEHQKHIDELKAKKGAEFDKAYVDLMVEDHEEDVSKFEKEANSGNDAEVKAFAAKTLPVLKQHLEHIKGIKDSMK